MVPSDQEHREAHDLNLHVGNNIMENRKTIVVMSMIKVYKASSRNMSLNLRNYYYDLSDIKMT